MNVLMELANGFATALTLQNLIYALIGCLVGTLIGVLPGIGPVAGVALLIPLTLNLEPTGAIIMLCAIFYGTAYGGTITSVLLNTPGEAASAITTIDGYEMTKQGRAGPALTIAALGSFVGGTIATILLVLAAAPAGLAGPADRAARILRPDGGRDVAAGRPGRQVHGRGADLRCPGPADRHGRDRPGRRRPAVHVRHGRLLDGVSFVAIVVGVFGLSEVLLAARRSKTPRRCTPGTSLAAAHRQGIAPQRPGHGPRHGHRLRCLGLIPGMTGSVSSLLSYGAEKRFSRYRDELGKGAIEGVAGPETANNAHANGALIPLFTLGIPASPTIAVLMGAFLQQGLSPGPTLFTEDADVAWAIIASLFIGNLILLLLNVPLVADVDLHPADSLLRS